MLDRIMNGLLFICGTLIIAWMLVVNTFPTELGDGNGTSYPSGTDDDNTVEVSTNFAREDVINDPNAAIVAIEAELGTDPAGGFSTVKDRLNSVSSFTVN
ncbi:hypothetical protein LCGC14_1912910, partial [marine sediment metagenome]